MAFGLKNSRPLDCFLVDELPPIAMPIYEGFDDHPVHVLIFDKDLGEFKVVTDSEMRAHIPLFQETPTDDAAFRVLRTLAGERTASSFKDAIKMIRDKDLEAEFCVQWGDDTLVVAGPEFVGRRIKSSDSLYGLFGYNPNTVVRVVLTPTEG